VFQIPAKAIVEVSPALNTTPPTYLAYIEWFSTLSGIPDPKHRMFRVSRSMRDGRRHAAVIPVDLVVCSVHLFPWFGPLVPKEWNSFTVLEECQAFYINPFTDVSSYLTFA